MEAYSSWGLIIARYDTAFACIVQSPRFQLNVLDALPVILDICGAKISDYLRLITPRYVCLSVTVKRWLLSW